MRKVSVENSTDCPFRELSFLGHGKVPDAYFCILIHLLDDNNPALMCNFPENRGGDFPEACPLEQGDDEILSRTVKTESGTVTFIKERGNL